MLVQMLALSPYSKNILGSNRVLGWDLPPQSLHTLPVRLTADCNLAVGVDRRVKCCFCLCVNHVMYG